jgi:ElaB/YqjD/DUF883 family membrane-anchored ribosome-binding protein
MINGTLPASSYYLGNGFSKTRRNHEKQGEERAPEQIMSTASTANQNFRDATDDTVHEAREGARDIGKATADTAADLREDLKGLRDDLGKLAEQVREILSVRGQAAWQHAKSGLDDVVAEARDSGRDATDAMREVTDAFTDVVDDALKTRPYTTLAIVAGLGFLFGVTWRR